MTTAGGGRLRAGDREREEVVERLREAHVEGRLTLEELEERVDLGYRATYVDELPALVADLPRPAAPATPGTRSAPSGPWRSGPWPRGPWGHGPGPLPFIVLVVVASVVLLAFGHPPFPLLWLVLVWLLWRRRAGRWRTRWSPQHEPAGPRT
jgi:hypothetical protein